MNEYRPTKYESRQIPTADLKVGDVINFPGAGAYLPIAEVGRRGAETCFIGIYESWGHLRRTAVWRKTGGRSTVHVPIVEAAAS